MKTILLLIAMLSIGCAQPQDRAKVGDRVSAFHVLDAKTGACIRLQQFLDSAKWNAYKSPASECER